MLFFRPVQEIDLKQICTFPQDERELFFMFPKAHFPLTGKQLQDSISMRIDSTVAVYDNTVVGFANFYEWKNEKCSIGNVVIDPSHRGKGIGKKLIVEMIRLAKEHHQANQICVSCFHENLEGLILYPKLGFVPHATEIRKDHAGNTKVLIHFSLDLKQGA